jgi:hypothetical protein
MARAARVDLLKDMVGIKTSMKAALRQRRKILLP